VADLRNTGKAGAGACTAAMFLKQFVSVPRWLHMDIAGVNSSDGSTIYHPSGMTGTATRTLFEFVRKQSQHKNS